MCLCLFLFPPSWGRLFPGGAAWLHFSCRRGKVCLIVKSRISWEVGDERREEEGGEKKRKKNLSLWMARLHFQHVASMYHTGFRRQQEHRWERGTGWAAAARSIVAGWGIPGHQETGEVWRCTSHSRQSAAPLQQTQPGAQAGQMHGPCKVCYFFISLGFGLL